MGKIYGHRWLRGYLRCRVRLMCAMWFSTGIMQEVWPRKGINGAKAQRRMRILLHLVGFSLKRCIIYEPLVFGNHSQVTLRLFWWRLCVPLCQKQSQKARLNSIRQALLRKSISHVAAIAMATTTLLLVRDPHRPALIFMMICFLFHQMICFLFPPKCSASLQFCKRGWG